MNNIEHTLFFEELMKSTGESNLKAYMNKILKAATDYAKKNIEHIEFENMGKPYKVYPNHGRYDPKTKTIILNSRLDKNRAALTLIHEMGHSVDHINKDEKHSNSKEWKKLSGWKRIGTGRINIDEYDYLIINENPKDVIRSDWQYKKDSKFYRDYSKRSPSEDFADTFVAAYMGMKHPDKDKVKYMKKLLNKLKGNKNTTEYMMSSSLESLWEE